MAKKENKTDIFLAASKASMQKATKTRTITLEEQEIIETVAEELSHVDGLIVPKNKTDWDALKTELDGKFAKKFKTILEDLPDREFVRIYLKILEFTRPKVIREPRGGGKDKPDTTINIQINRGK